VNEPHPYDDPSAEVARALLNPVMTTSIRLAYEKVLADRKNYDPLFRNWPFGQAELSLCVGRAVAAACAQDGSIRRLFAKRAIPKLARPHLVSEDDLCEAFVATMRAEMADFEIAYRLFVGRVIQLIENCEFEGHFAFCWHQDWTYCEKDEVHGDEAEKSPLLSREFHTERERVEDIDSVDAVWSRNGVELKLEIVPLAFATEGATDELTTRASLCRLGLVMSGPIAAGAQRAMHDSLSRCLGIIAACIEPVPESVGPTVLSTARILEEREIIGELVDCVLLTSESGDKDKLAQRVGIALRLLGEAADQKNSAISLALSVTALESLLGASKGEAIAKPLGERVAVLLEARGEYRLAAERFVGELYNERSRVLHGESILPRADWYSRCRFLVLRVIYVIARWRLMLRKLGEHELLTPDQLLRLINESKYGQSPFTGSTETDDVAVFLWAPNVPRRK
jgi:hypothetical protein